MSEMGNGDREPIPPEAAIHQELNDLFSWYVKSAERIADIQKNIIDVAVQQDAEVLGIWKRATEKAPGALRPLASELAATALRRYGETQKGVIDLMLEQTRTLAELAKDRTVAVKKATEGATSMVQQVVERSVETQKKVLDNSAEQTKAAFESARQQFGFTGGQAEEAAQTFRRGVDTMVETQKEMLDLVTH